MKLQSFILMLLTFLNELCLKIENTLGSMLQINVVLIAVPVHSAVISTAVVSVLPDKSNSKVTDFGPKDSNCPKKMWLFLIPCATDHHFGVINYLVFYISAVVTSEAES